MSWGLQYTALERLGGPSRYEGRVGGPFRQEGRLGKRKANTDNGSRRVRAREGQDDDFATGSESAYSQDVDGHESQPGRTAPVHMQVPPRTRERNNNPYGDHPYGNLAELLRAAADEKEYQQNNWYREPSEHTRLEWRVGSETTMERRRRRGVRRLMRELRHQEQPSTDTSKTTLSPDHRQRPESIPSPDHPQRPESIPPSNQPQLHNQEQLSTHTSESTSPYRP